MPTDLIHRRIIWSSVKREITQLNNNNWHSFVCYCSNFDWNRFCCTLYTVHIVHANPWLSIYSAAKIKLNRPWIFNPIYRLIIRSNPISAAETKVFNYKSHQCLVAFHRSSSFCGRIADKIELLFSKTFVHRIDVGCHWKFDIGYFYWISFTAEHAQFLIRGSLKKKTLGATMTYTSTR